MFRERGTIEAGQRIEEELFGKALVDPGKEKPDYLPYGDAFRDARKRQPGDPTDPKTDFAYQVLITIEEMLDAEGKVRFYTASGTALDRYHGVGAWFEMDGNRMATIDLTRGRGKGKGKTDIDFPVPSDGLDRSSGDGTEFLGHTQALAESVVGVLAAEEKLVRAS